MPQCWPPNHKHGVSHVSSQLCEEGVWLEVIISYREEMYEAGWRRLAVVLFSAGEISCACGSPSNVVYKQWRNGMSIHTALTVLAVWLSSRKWQTSSNLSVYLVTCMQ